MQHVALMRSPDAPGEFSLGEFSSCMWNLATMINVTDRPMPRILIMHVSEAVAAHFGVNRTGVIRHNRSSAGEPLSYYEVWIVGDADVCNYVVALLGVLEDHFLLDISTQERQRVVESAIWAVGGCDLAQDRVQ